MPATITRMGILTPFSRLRARFSAKSALIAAFSAPKSLPPLMETATEENPCALKYACHARIAPSGCDEIKEFIPLIKPEKAAYGAGRKDFDHPNVLRIIKSSDMAESDEIDVIETNIDHLTGEEIGYLFDVLLDAGASDVSITPIIMKKNRQGSLLKVISRKDKREDILND
ncbi:MAG: DUF111 family protein, partial [Clostridia bacterium]|nr:DUF111 family protein [Clostridia bacterium]